MSKLCNEIRRDRQRRDSRSKGHRLEGARTRSAEYAYAVSMQQNDGDNVSWHYT